MVLSCCGFWELGSSAGTACTLNCRASSPALRGSKESTTGSRNGPSEMSVSGAAEMLLGRACRETQFRQSLSKMGKGLVYRPRSIGQDRFQGRGKEEKGDEETTSP